MKHNFFLKISLIYFFILTNNAFPLTQNKIIANVQNQIISSYELKNKIKAILFVSKQELNQDNVNFYKQEAMRALIDYKLKKEEITKFNIVIDNNIQTDNYLKNLASRYNTNIEGLRKIFVSNNIDFEMYLDEIKIEFAWQQLIFNLYKDKISLNNNEIEEELNNFVKKKENIDEYKLLEIELLLKNNSEDKGEIEKVKKQIDLLGFENTAIKFSTASSAIDGGNLGWINSKSLSNKIYNIVKMMQVGEVSQPIFQGETATFLKLTDKKSLKINNINLNEIREKIIVSKKNEYLSLFSNNHLSKIKNNALIQIK